MKVVNKLAAILCLLMLPSTVFAEQTDRPQHPKMVVSSTQYDTPQTTPTNKTSISASPTETNIPTDVKIVSDLGSDLISNKPRSVFSCQEGYNPYYTFAGLTLSYFIFYPRNESYIQFMLVKDYLFYETKTRLHIICSPESDIVLKRKKAPVLITLSKQGIIKKTFPTDYFGGWYSNKMLIYELPQNFFNDVVNVMAVYIEFYGENGNKIWVKIPQDVASQFNEVFETDMKKKIKENK